jgi:hypothetical protein
MRDRRFRDRLPPELKEDVEKYLKNPSCKCNSPLYDKIAISCKSQIQEYFPNKKFVEEIDIRPQSIWMVINCHIGELEGRLKKLSPGDKKIAIARWQDQVTVVVEEG